MRSRAFFALCAACLPAAAVAERLAVARIAMDYGPSIPFLDELASEIGAEFELRPVPPVTGAVYPADARKLAASVDAERLVWAWVVRDSSVLHVQVRLVTANGVDYDQFDAAVGDETELPRAVALRAAYLITSGQQLSEVPRSPAVDRPPLRVGIGVAPSAALGLGQGHAALGAQLWGTVLYRDWLGAVLGSYWFPVVREEGLDLTFFGVSLGWAGRWAVGRLGVSPSVAVFASRLGVAAAADQRSDALVGADLTARLSWALTERALLSASLGDLFLPTSREYRVGRDLRVRFPNHLLTLGVGVFVVLR